MNPVIYRCFIDVAEAPPLFGLVASALADEYCFVFEVTLQATTRVEMDHVVLLAVEFPQLIALHAMAAE